MINKELFEGPVGDYCIARNTIKCLFKLMYIHNWVNELKGYNCKFGNEILLSIHFYWFV